MAEGAAAATIAATAYQIYANEQSTKEKEKVALQEAQANDIAAAEMQDRYEINKSRLTKDYNKYVGQASLATASAGIDMSGSSLLLLEQVNRDYQDELYNMQRESKFRVYQQYQEGTFARNRAESISQVGRIQTTGLFMQGAAQVAGIYNK